LLRPDDHADRAPDAAAVIVPATGIDPRRRFGDVEGDILPALTGQPFGTGLNIDSTMKEAAR
jgi:hypothetical protein